ncbi:tyrosine-type recombinase/integrase [Micromonospora sp. NPDC049903]|uniref:tyrosine-type recombinase/integrase n=1 Tax=Micromonospora sp. NPDC049903 TaxID=3364276 RepID=UPI0037976B84
MRAVMSGRPGLRLVQGTVAVAVATGEIEQPWAFQARCVGGWVSSMVARNFSALTIENDNATLDRFLELAGQPAWELTPADVDRVVEALVARGTGSVTRRDYVRTFRQFFRYLLARHAVEIEQRFGVRLQDPIDEFHAGRHVDDTTAIVPPTPERMDEFFAFIRTRMGVARKWAPWARDYALYRTLYHAGLRASEVTKLEIRDVHFDRGPFGKLHVRFGKAAKGSGPRPRWVPMLDDLHLILRWYLRDVRPRFRKNEPTLFCDEGGGLLSSGTVRNRLKYLLKVEGHGRENGFSPHALRHGCATRNYERGVDLVAIQQMLGHWHVGTTMGYVTPSATFIEDAYRSAVSATLNELTGEHGTNKE